MLLPAERRKYFDSIFCFCVQKEDLNNQREPLFDDGKFVWWPIRVGDSILFYGKRNSFFPFQCHIGPDWHAVVIVFASIVFTNVLVLSLIRPLGWPVILIGGVGDLCVTISYSCVAFSDPGTIYKHGDSGSNEESINGLEENVESTNKYSKVTSTNHKAKKFKICETKNNLNLNTPQIDCDICAIKRPTTASHCPYCGVCVNKLDHHCPWCGKCIAKRNLTCFSIFIISLQFQMYFLCCSCCYCLAFVYIFHTLPVGPPI